jgi:hypothetical protein
MMDGTPAMTMTFPIHIPVTEADAEVRRIVGIDMAPPAGIEHELLDAKARRSCMMASARGSMSIETSKAFATQSAVISSWVGPMPPVVKTYVAMTQRIERINDRRLLVANHPHFHEVDAKRGEILRDVPYVLVLGASR